MGSVTLVTGAASGIGRACAHAFADEGVERFVLADLDSEGLQSLQLELKEANNKANILIITTDTASESDVQHMVDEGVKEFGAIHYAVLCAGVTSKPRVRTDELPTEAWDRVININLRGVWLCQRALIQQMLKQPRDLGTTASLSPQRGSIVNISSVLGRVAHPTNGSYAAAKAGILGMTRTDAVAYGRDGIRINAVCPGLIKTPLVEASIKAGANYDKMLPSIPLNRYGLPAEIAQLCVFLASSRASFITGAEITADGGQLANL